MGLATWRTDESPTPCRLCLNKKKPAHLSLCHRPGKVARCFGRSKSSAACAGFLGRALGGKSQQWLPYRDEP